MVDLPTGNRRSWIQRCLCYIWPASHAKAALLPLEVYGFLAERRAAALKASIRLASKNKKTYPSFVAALLAAIRDAGWDQHEVDCVVAYTHLFSDNIRPGYDLIVAGRLAETDFDLLRTACVSLYYADRFEEAYGLIGKFDLSNASGADMADFFSFAGYVTLAAGKDIHQATRYFDEALDQGINTALLAVNSYPIYFEAGNHSRVDQVRELIFERYRKDPEATYALAYVELARDYYPEGFRLAESRYHMPEVARAINESLLARPRWQGGSLTGKRLLVHAEQGLGDIVMISRYLPWLQAQGVDVILDCREAAVPLLANNFPGVKVIGGDLQRTIDEPFDFWVGAMSLPFLADSTAETIPAKAGYLSSPQEQSDYWHVRVAQLTRLRCPRVGIAWSGNPGHRADKRRSIPFGQILPYIQACSHVTFFALQLSVPVDAPSNLIDVSAEMVTLADTAALIAEMDLVITVDTSVVHLAGALGKQAWLMLPSRYEWRWSLEGEGNNWYDSVSVLRQRSHGDWEFLLEDIFQQRLPAYIRGLERTPE